MPIKSYKSIKCIRPKDSTTDFLDPIGNLFRKDYIVIGDNDQEHMSIISLLSKLEPTSLIIFLGHGTSTSLYSASSRSYKQQNFITKDHNYLFNKHNTLFLAC